MRPVQTVQVTNTDATTRQAQLAPQGLDAVEAAAKVRLQKYELCRAHDRQQLERERTRKALEESEQYRLEVEQPSERERHGLRERARVEIKGHQMALRE